MPGAEDACLAADVALDLRLRPPLIEAMKRDTRKPPLATLAGPPKIGQAAKRCPPTVCAAAGELLLSQAGRLLAESACDQDWRRILSRS